MGNKVFNDNEEQPVALEKVATLTIMTIEPERVLQESDHVHGDQNLSKGVTEDRETMFSATLGPETFHVRADDSKRIEGETMERVATARNIADQKQKKKRKPVVRSWNRLYMVMILLDQTVNVW